MSTQSSPRRATSPESSPEYGYANAPGPQQEESDDVVFLLSVPRRCRLHARGPQTAGPSSSGGAADNPIVVEDDEGAPSTGEARADDNVVVISDEEEEEERPNAPPSPTTNNGNAAVRARPTTGDGNTIFSSIVIEDSDHETPTTSVPWGNNKRERSPSSTNPPATRPRHQ
ncbi:hypothetical protein CDV31_002898 [Fusarium ambrosium]|uniref:Uncharacterized protein n=1 Tax=Fusarium ambrosium TaxID=131363 RepID=A0A428UV45_9HYPO|nr:hypothetical protein CDV31_002898 [Fusarium ambrosium]